MSPTQRASQQIWRPARWAWAGAGLGALLGLLAFAPATVLAWLLGIASNGRVLLQEPRGTVWQGSAALWLTGGSGAQDRAGLPGRLAWRISPAWLGLRLQLSAPCCSAAPIVLYGRLGWNSRRVELANAPVQWPSALLAGLGTPWNTLGLRGVMRFESQDLSVEWAQGQTQIKGVAALTASQLASRLATIDPLGDYRLSFNGSAVNNLQLQTLAGELQLSGAGNWDGARLRFAGVAEAAPEQEAALANLLGVLGQREGARARIALDQ